MGESSANGAGSREPGDFVVRAVAGEGTIRAVAAVTTRSVAEARERHGSYPTATAAMGRVLTAAGLMAATLGDEQSVTIRVAGSGPAGTIFADGDGDGNVRGYMQNPKVDLPLNPLGKLAVADAVGLPGFLHVTRDPGLGRPPYTGTAALVTGEIGDDFTAYFARSEQLPSLVALGVLVNPDGGVAAAGGMMVQMLPGADESWADHINDRADALNRLSWQIEGGLTPEQMVDLVLGGTDARIVHRSPLGFKCRCSRDRARGILSSLASDELEAMADEDGGAELRCHFCSETYNFDEESLRELVSQKQSGET